MTNTRAAIAALSLALFLPAGAAAQAPAAPAPERTTAISGYMDFHFNKREFEDGRIDFHRFVLLITHRFSDRIRYYWPHADVRSACEAMLERLGRTAIPLTLLSQYLPNEHEAVRAGRIEPTPAAILREGVGRALRPYLAACGHRTGAAP